MVLIFGFSETISAAYAFLTHIIGYILFIITALIMFFVVKKQKENLFEVVETEITRSMKKYLTLYLLLIISVFSFAQTPNEVRGSMGIDFVSIPSLKDYIDQLPYEQLSVILTQRLIFLVLTAECFPRSFQLQAELGYLLYSFTACWN
ncbi:MAG: hypothetical protein MZV64_54665 [Ignavibacteriales bacterium]|nr:hypothetical protein [Ignavibacteriales bacterium]